jgi:hypothetical protein
MQRERGGREEVGKGKLLIQAGMGRFIYSRTPMT